MSRYRINLTVEDSDGETDNVRFIAEMNFPWFSVGDIKYRVELLWSVIKPLCDGVLVHAEAALEFDEFIPEWSNNTLDVLSDIQEKLKLEFNVDGMSQTFKAHIPTIREAQFVNSGAGKILDLTDTDLQAFITYVISPTADTALGGVDSHGVDLVSLKSGKQWFGKG